MRKPRHLKRTRGASLVEVTAGLFLLLPLFLCIIDLSAIVLGQITNDSLAKRVARAAAHQNNASAASAAATAVITATAVNGIVSSPALVNMNFNDVSPGNVICETKVLITIPAPVPFVPLLQRSREMRARATEPIVMLPALP
jgi:Flp pilus assembly protein TadG